MVGTGVTFAAGVGGMLVSGIRPPVAAGAQIG
jgi:hypothetical protein